MADTTEVEQAEVTEPQGTETTPIDYETKYKEAVAQSRKWEERAKASYKDSEELKALKESKAAEEQSTAAQLDELKHENEQLKTAQQQAEWKKAASAATGVPIDVLRGNSEEEINAHAAALAALLKQSPKLPTISDPAKAPEGEIADTASRKYIRKLFGSEK